MKKSILFYLTVLLITAVLFSGCSGNKDVKENDTSPKVDDIPEISDVISETEAEEAEPLPDFEDLEDPYANVRFGDTRDTLLLEIEWHTYESYTEELQASGDVYDENHFTIQELKKDNIYISKTINGRDYTLADTVAYGAEPEKTYDGYYIFEVYPYTPYVYYFDENNEYQCISFGMDKYTSFVQSKEEYDYTLEKYVIPYCDQLLKKGLITQQEYDTYTITDPLYRYLKRFFGCDINELEIYDKAYKKYLAINSNLR